MKIFFDKASAKFVLDSMNKAIDNEGFIVEKETKKRVLTPDGSEIELDDFAGIIPGSEIFLKNDANSLLRLYDKTHGSC